MLVKRYGEQSDNQWLLRCFMIFFAILFAIQLSIQLSGCSEEDASLQHTPPPPAVVVTKIKNTPIGDYHEFVARTEAVEEVDLRARAEGYIIKRGFIEGENVQKNQLLFEIDRAPFMAAINSAQADLDRTQAAEIKAERDLVRGRELRPEGFISQSDLDKLNSDFDQARASVEAAQAALETARINLSYTRITAPFTGVIGKERYSVGNFVGSTSDPLARLTSVDPIYVNFQLNEKDLLTFQQESGTEEDKAKEYALSLRLSNNTEYNEPGTFNFADTRIDETTGTINLRAVFPNPNGILFPGMYVTLLAESHNKTLCPLIPQAAVQENQQGRFALVVDEKSKPDGKNTVSSRYLQLGRRVGPMWVVKEGLKPGERIIIEGLQKVQDGGAVNPVERQVDVVTGAIIKPDKTDTSTNTTKG